MVPYQNEIPSRAGGATAFAGLNRHEKIGDGEWAEMENLTTEEYPVAMVRPLRRKAKFYTEATVDEETVRTYYDIGPRIWATHVSGGYTPHHICDAETVNGELFLLDDHGCLYREGDQWISELGTAFTGKLDIETAPAREQMVAMGRDLVFKGGAVFRRATDEIAGSTVAEKLEDLITNRWQNAFAKVAAPCTVTLCNDEGTDVTVKPQKPATPAEGDYYYDAENMGLYRYSETEDRWVPMTSSYLKLEFDFSGTPYSSSGSWDWRWQGDYNSLFDGNTRNDCVTLGFRKSSDIGQAFAWLGIMIGTGGEISSYIVEKSGWSGTTQDPQSKGYLIVRGSYLPYFTGLDPAPGLSVTRRMPVLDYICEHENRVWGCRYGLNDRGEFVNEIYCTVLGDPLNWFRYEGTAADSYTASVGTGEEFTGCCSLDDYVVFFKKDRVYLISGSEPSNFRRREIICPGVQKDGYRSVVALNSAIYYKGERGIYRMTAYNLPSLISDALGEDHWHDAITGTDGRRLFVAMLRDEDDVQEVYEYDTFTGMWTRDSGFRGVIPAHQTNEEEDLPVAAMTPFAGNLLVVTTAKNVYYDHIELFFPRPSRLPENISMTNMEPYTANPLGNPALWNAELVQEDPVKWYGVTGMRGTVTTSVKGAPLADYKRVRKIQMRCRAETGTKVKVSIMYDEDGVWHEIINERQKRTGTFLMRYEPSRRCDIYRLKIEGEGPFVLYSIIDEYENAGSYGGEP